MRFLLLVLVVTLPLAPLAQNAAPPWPEITLDSCPALAQPRGVTQRSWKHGEEEQREFWAAVSTTDSKKNAELLSKFIEKYPDSDYREPALFGEWAAYVSLTDRGGQLRAAEMMVRLPDAEPLTRTAGFLTLTSGMSPYVRPEDPQKDRKLADLEKWTQCGMAASTAQQKPQSMAEDAFQKKRRYEESIFDRTSGFASVIT